MGDFLNIHKWDDINFKGGPLREQLAWAVYDKNREDTNRFVYNLNREVLKAMNPEVVVDKIKGINSLMAAVSRLIYPDFARDVRERLEELASEHIQEALERVGE